MLTPVQVHNDKNYMQIRITGITGGMLPEQRDRWAATKHANCTIYTQRRILRGEHCVKVCQHCLHQVVLHGSQRCYQERVLRPQQSGAKDNGHVLSLHFVLSTVFNHPGWGGGWGGGAVKYTRPCALCGLPICATP